MPGNERLQRSTQQPPSEIPAVGKVPFIPAPAPGMFYLQHGSNQVRPDLIEKAEQISQGRY